MTQKISEQAVLFGARTSLVGIVARGACAPPGRPAVVILNTGIVHRVGHHRMFVTLSRALAADGYTALRFDFSGIGDSAPRDDQLSPEDACRADIKDAIDWLERDHKPSRIILVGLCSGADHAVSYGHTDPRVIGLVLMDPSIPPTLRYYMDYIAQRLGRGRSWVRVLSGRSRTLRMVVRSALSRMNPGWTARFPVENLISRDAVERHYQKSVDNKIDILAIFTEDTTRQTYREQLIEALPNVPFGGRLTLEYFPGSTHTFALESDRSRLIQMIIQWLGTVAKAAC